MKRDTKEPIRCAWCMKDDLYKSYHDREWGRPSYDKQHLFEMLILETMQAGLSWYTILVKRENFRAAFDGFDPIKMAAYGEEKIAKLLRNEGIIRNRLKIQAAITNARQFLDIEANGSFTEYMWQFTEGKIIDNRLPDLKNYPVTTSESDAMSKAMKKRGFKFVGSTTCYAYMQSVGMVNDHVLDCWVRKEMEIG